MAGWLASPSPSSPDRKTEKPKGLTHSFLASQFTMIPFFKHTHVCAKLRDYRRKIQKGLHPRKKGKQSKRCWRHSRFATTQHTHTPAVSRVRRKDPGCRPPTTPQPKPLWEWNRGTVLFRAPPEKTSYRDLVHTFSPTFSSSPVVGLFISPETAPPGKREIMEAPISEEKLNARRKAIVLKGLPLLALSFQTLGTPPIVSTPPVILWSCGLTHRSGIIYSDIGTVSIVTFSRRLKSR